MSFSVGQENSFSSLNGHFKETYADKIQNLIPDGVQLLKRIAFMKSEKMPGRLYHQPVILSNESGFTYGGSAGTAFALNEASNSQNADAQIQGTELVLRSYLSVAAASRSANSKAAFISETKLLVENMLRSFSKRMEIGLLYGQANIGEVEAVALDNVTLTISAHTWAAGIWAGAENTQLEIFSPNYATKRGGTFVTVLSVDLDTKQIVIDNAVVGAALVVGDVIHFRSAALVGGTFNEFAGIHKIVTNTGSLFNVNASAYNLWKGNTYEVGTNFSGGEAVLSFAAIEKGIAKAMAKGLVDQEVTVLIAYPSFTNLLTEQTAKRRYDSSYDGKELKDGAQTLKFFGPNGQIEVVPSIYVKEGYAYIIPVKEFMRVGSTDITFEQPGFEGKFVRLLENNNGYEMRSYTDQALFTSKPGLCTLLTFIKS